MFTGRSKADTFWTSNKQASKEQLNNMYKQFVIKFMLQFHQLPKCSERKCREYWFIRRSSRANFDDSSSYTAHAFDLVFITDRRTASFLFHGQRQAHSHCYINRKHRHPLTLLRAAFVSSKDNTGTRQCAIFLLGILYVVSHCICFLTGVFHCTQQVT